MKEIYLNKSLSFIEKHSSNFDDSKKNIMRYGLESLYLSITKIIPILIVAWILGIIRESIIFILIYNGLRFFAFGIHASKTYICFITSLALFLVLPYLSTILVFNTTIKVIISILSLISFVLYSPADTYKKPLVNKKKRKVLKVISTMLLLLYIFLAFYIKNNFYINTLIFAMITESLLINKYIYKLFKLPFDNYKEYLKEV